MARIARFTTTTRDDDEEGEGEEEEEGEEVVADPGQGYNKPVSRPGLECNVLRDN